jgi:peptide/nickel transport system ATP-binding protein
VPPHTSAEKEAHIHVAVPDAKHRIGHTPMQGCLFQPRCTQAIDPCGSEDIPMTPRDGHGVRCLRGGIANLLTFEGVEKSYGTVRALRPTDLSLFCGEVFCLVGETGSGKSTLAMLAAGAISPDAGRRWFDGMNADQNHHHITRDIGMIYQNPSEAVSHRFTVFDIVAEPLSIQQGGKHIGGRPAAKSDIRHQVLRALSDVHLSTEPEFLKRFPHELNLGAIQRLCLARALVHHPKLLIADEPTSALDPSVQAKILKMLLELQTEKGLTMLFVTHDIGLARKIGDRIGVMLAGRMMEIGPAVEVLNRPAHPYTRMLIQDAGGSNAFNWKEFHTKIEEGAEGCPFAPRCAHAEEDCRQEQAPVSLNGGRRLVRCRRPLTRHWHQDARVENCYIN